MTRAELYRRLPLTSADRWWVELARRSADGRVLELGAGSGRLSRALVAEGVEVVAVERDPAMLAALHEQVGGAVTIVDADVTELGDLGRFGVVVMPASLLNELATPGDRAATIARAAAACRSDGVVGMQLLGPWWLAALPATSMGHLVPADGSPPIEVVVDAAALDAWSGRRRATLTYRFDDGEMMRDHLDAAVVTPTELSAALDAAGLTMMEVWGVEPGVTPLTAGDTVWHVLAQPRS